MDHWQDLAPVPAGGIVSAVALSPDYGRDRTIYIGTSEGLFTSRDGGQSWQAALPEAPSFQVQSVAIAPGLHGKGTVLVGGAGPGILRSVDGGATWALVPFEAPPECVTTALAVSPAFPQDGIALLGTLEDGIFRSTDGGRNWTAVNFGLLSLGVLAVAASPAMESDRKAYAITEDGLYISPNEGRAWKAIPGATIEDMLGLALVASPNLGPERVLYMGTEGAGVWRSDDGGQSWKALSSFGSGTVNALCFAGSGGGLRLYAGTAAGEILRSSDGGETWQRSAEGASAVMALASRGPEVVAGLYDGVTALRVGAGQG